MIQEVEFTTSVFVSIINLSSVSSSNKFCSVCEVLLASDISVSDSDSQSDSSELKFHSPEATILSHLKYLR